MLDVYNTLSQLEYFVPNEYLYKYARLIERNSRTPIRGDTNKHHILPKAWFKLTNNAVNNELNNLVNLVYRDHVLAHYYLCLCTEDPFKYANQLALMCLETRKKLFYTDKQLLHQLPLYNNIYEDFVYKRSNNYKLYKEEQQ